jgi:uncharacterized membrane protein
MSAERPHYIEQLRAEVRGLPLRPATRKPAAPPQPDFDEARYLFTVCTGNRWMDLGERQPEPKMLFGPLWYQGELCILFADTNVGKSVLAVQIANSIARRRPIRPFPLNAPQANVLYIDFELSTRQFYQRYSHQQRSYNFNDRFFRAEFNANNGIDLAGNTGIYNDFLFYGIEYKINLVKPTVLIIDNITCLRGGTENAAVALSLMQNLKALKAQHNLSILVLAHTPKRRNPCTPLSPDDLHGSKLLINFADSAFAIGKSSTDPHLRYIKQIKQRSTAQIYGDDNVALCRIIKTRNFLRFRFEGTSPERPHLLPAGRHGRNRNKIDHQQMAQKIAELSTQGLSQRQISNQLHIALGLVNKLMPG